MNTKTSLKCLAQSVIEGGTHAIVSELTEGPQCPATRPARGGEPQRTLVLVIRSLLD